MPSYPTYKLGEICIIERGGSPRPIKNYLTNADDGINWIKIGDATLSNKYIYKTAEKIKPEGLSKTRKVEFGDLILSNSMSFGRPYIMRTSGCIHDGWVVFRLNKEIIDEEYLYTILSSNEVYAQFNHLATGSTVKNLNIDRIKEVVIPLPPLPTQHQIVARIEALFAELDKAAEHLRTAQQQLKTYCQAVLNHWLNNDDGKWEMVKLKDICLSISDGDHLPPKRTTQGIPFITISDIKGNCIDYSDVSYMTEGYYESLSDSRKAQIGDILYTVTGSFGIPVMVEDDKKFCFQRHIGLVRPNPNLAAQKWLYYMMQSPIIYSQANEKATGTAQKTVTLTVLRDFNLPLPPLSDQHRIVQEIESRLSQAEAAEASIAEALQKTEALRQSILKKAFSGELNL